MMLIKNVMGSLVFILLVCACNNLVHKKTIGSYHSTEPELLKQLDSLVIQGVVIDKEEKNAIQYASVSILNNKTLLKGTVTNENGYFSIVLPEGEFILEVNSTGKTKIVTQKRKYKKGKSYKYQFELGYISVR